MFENKEKYLDMDTEEILQLINQECFRMFGSKYTNALAEDFGTIENILEAITEDDDKIMLQTVESGGDYTIRSICESLDLKIIDMPYDYKNKNIDYAKTYEILKKENIKFMLYEPKDIMNTPDYSKLKIPNNTIFIYGIRYIIGLIAGKKVDNPLEKFEEENCIVFAILAIGMEKMRYRDSMNGLILTNSAVFSKKIEEETSFLEEEEIGTINLLSFLLEM